MPAGPGKYDDVVTKMREETQAKVAIAIIIEGNKGSGFSVQAEENVGPYLPNMLRSIASEIERVYHDECKATQVPVRSPDGEASVPDDTSSSVLGQPPAEGTVL